MLQLTRRSIEPGIMAVQITDSIHSGPECARLCREVDELIAAGERRIIFDMAGVTYADSAAIGAIIKCFSKLKSANGALRIAAVQPMIDHSLKLTKVDQVIGIFPSVDQAVQGFAVADASTRDSA